MGFIVWLGQGVTHHTHSSQWVSEDSPINSPIKTWSKKHGFYSINMGKKSHTHYRGVYRGRHRGAECEIFLSQSLPSLIFPLFHRPISSLLPYQIGRGQVWDHSICCLHPKMISNVTFFFWKFFIWVHVSVDPYEKTKKKKVLYEKIFGRRKVFEWSHTCPHHIS